LEPVIINNSGIIKDGKGYTFYVETSLLEEIMYVSL